MATLIFKLDRALVPFLFNYQTSGMSRCRKPQRGSWIGTRRVAPCTFPHPLRLEPCVRLSPHTAQHLRSFSMVKNTMKRPFTFLQHTRSSPCTACAFAGYLCSDLPEG